jgi:predicted RNA-binding Zn-ribbon protein involved in translation (DUF1610 family)
VRVRRETTMLSDKQRPYPKIRLRTIRAPAIGAVTSAPPVLNASDHTIDYYCPNCGTVLLLGEEGQVPNVTIRCTKCGSYNSTHVK